LTTTTIYPLLSLSFTIIYRFAGSLKPLPDHTHLVLQECLPGLTTIVGNRTFEPDRLWTIDNGVKVEVVTYLRHGQLGLFTARSFHAKDFITEYEGRVEDYEVAKQSRDESGGEATHTVHLMPFAYVLVGYRVPVAGQGGAQFANDPRPDRTANAQYVMVSHPRFAKHQTDNGRMVPGRLVLRALCYIPPNTEILVSYGNDYRMPNTDSDTDTE
jgi:hypothetical protein